MYTTIVNAKNLKKGDIIVGKRNVKIEFVRNNKTTNVENRNQRTGVLIPHRGLFKVLNFKSTDKVKIIRPDYNKES